jgi:hypothetical protein
VKVVDANVLLYAVNESAEHHEEAVGWLDAALSGQSTVGFSWISLLAFLRLSTKIGLFPPPLSLVGGPLLHSGHQPQGRGTVQRFPDDVGMAGVTGGFLDQVQQKRPAPDSVVRGPG